VQLSPRFGFATFASLMRSRNRVGGCWCVYLDAPAPKYPHHIASRAHIRPTVCECHWPPAGVAIFRLVNSIAIARSDIPASSARDRAQCLGALERRVPVLSALLVDEQSCNFRREFETTARAARSGGTSAEGIAVTESVTVTVQVAAM
jgi:hypothetical protein